MNDYTKSFFLTRHLTYKDYYILINLIENDIGQSHISASRLHLLYLLVENSIKYNAESIPEDVVTLNSEIILVSEEIQKNLVKIVLPRDIKEKNDVSVYSPVGLAILGKRVKDSVCINTNSTRQKIQIEKLVFQPEKEKMFHL